MRLTVVFALLLCALLGGCMKNAEVAKKPEQQAAPEVTDGILPSNQMESADEQASDREDFKFYANNGCTFYIDENGILWGWGNNNDSCLAIAERALYNTPVMVPIPEQVIDMAPGPTCLALTESGTLYTWGVDMYDYEGTNRHVDPTPKKVEMPEKVAALWNGRGMGMARGESGDTYLWGWNYQGQLGDGTTDVSMVPVKLDIPSKIVDISSYDTHVIALCADGFVYTWGSNYFGELGNGEDLEIGFDILPERGRTRPETVDLPETIIAVAAGRGVSYALTEDGRLFSWGANDVGQLGVGEEVEFSSSPVEIQLDEKITAVFAGAFHTFALTEKGELYGWGYNSRENEEVSVLGIGKNDLIVYSPTLVKTEEPILTVSAGAKHNFAMTVSGKILAWGSNRALAIDGDSDDYINSPRIWSGNAAKEQFEN